MQGLRLGVSSPGQRRRAPRAGASSQGPRAEHDRHGERARGDASASGRRRSRSRRPARCTASRTSSPRPRTPRFPVQTSLYAASKLAGEGHDRRVRPRVRVHRAGVPVRLDPGRALHPRPRVRLLLRAQARPEPAAGARERSAGEVLPVRRGLRRGDHDRRRPSTKSGRASSAIYNLGTDETVVVDDSIAVDLPAHGSRSRARVHRREARMAGRQPADRARLRADPRARLASDARPSNRRSSARSTGSTPIRTRGRARDGSAAVSR